MSSFVGLRVIFATNNKLVSGTVTEGPTPFTGEYRVVQDGARAGCYRHPRDLVVVAGAPAPSPAKRHPLWGAPPPPPAPVYAMNGDRI